MNNFFLCVLFVICIPHKQVLDIFMELVFQIHKNVMGSLARSHHWSAANPDGKCLTRANDSPESVPPCLHRPIPNLMNVQPEEQDSLVGIASPPNEILTFFLSPFFFCLLSVTEQNLPGGVPRFRVVSPPSLHRCASWSNRSCWASPATATSTSPTG